MRTITIAIFAALMVFWPCASQALTGDEILKKTEDTLNAPKDRMAIQKMTLIGANGAVKVREMKVYQKGAEQRMIVFLTPADAQGVGFLAITEERMYLYLPAFRKVRRIASHIKNENFLGTDFSYEDLAETRYTDDYNATLASEEPGAWILNLAPLSDADVSYSRLRMWVDKSAFLPLRIEYFIGGATPIKVMRAANLSNEDGYHYPGKVEMETLKSGHKTIIEVVDIAHDAGLEDRFFTERNLKRQGR